MNIENYIAVPVGCKTSYSAVGIALALGNRSILAYVLVQYLK
jgi:hypothetical protein